MKEVKLEFKFDMVVLFVCLVGFLSDEVKLSVSADEVQSGLSGLGQCVSPSITGILNRGRIFFSPFFFISKAAGQGSGAGLRRP